jgi:hypothetical protein
MYLYISMYCRLSSEEFHAIVINSARSSVASCSPLEMAAISALVMDCFLVSKTAGMSDGGLYAFK